MWGKPKYLETINHGTGRGGGVMIFYTLVTICSFILRSVLRCGGKPEYLQ